MEDIKNIFKLDSEERTKILKKGELLQHAGEVQGKAYFVKKGLLRSYTIDEKGNEHVFMFAPEGWVIADMDARIFSKESVLFVDCIEDSEVIEIDRDVLNLSDLNREQLQTNIKMISKRVVVLQRRVLMLMSASAKDRYQRFLETYPELPNRVPQKMIASYLGIRPQTLSSIRGALARES